MAKRTDINNSECPACGVTHVELEDGDVIMEPHYLREDIQTTFNNAFLKAEEIERLVNICRQTERKDGLPALQSKHPIDLHIPQLLFNNLTILSPEILKLLALTDRSPAYGNYYRKLCEEYLEITDQTESIDAALEHGELLHSDFKGGEYRKNLARQHDVGAKMFEFEVKHKLASFYDVIRTLLFHIDQITPPRRTRTTTAKTAATNEVVVELWKKGKKDAQIAEALNKHENPMVRTTQAGNSWSANSAAKRRKALKLPAHGQ